MSSYDIQLQVEDQYDTLKEETLRGMGTAYCEPANEYRYSYEEYDGYGL